jgi:hypothetical protein
MRVMGRGDGYKKETDYQVVPNARKTTRVELPAVAVNVLLQTVRQK